MYTILIHILFIELFNINKNKNKNKLMSKMANNDSFSHTLWGKCKIKKWWYIKYLKYLDLHHLSRCMYISVKHKHSMYHSQAT